MGTGRSFHGGDWAKLYTEEIWLRADTDRSVIQCARLFLCALDELIDRGDDKFLARRNHDGEAGEWRNQDKFLRIVAKLLVERQIGGQRARSRADQRVSVGSSRGPQRGAEISTSAGFVYHHDRLPEQRRHLVEENPADHVAGAAAGKRHDYRNGPIWETLRACGVGDQRGRNPQRNRPRSAELHLPRRNLYPRRYSIARNCSGALLQFELGVIAIEPFLFGWKRCRLRGTVRAHAIVARPDRRGVVHLIEFLLTPREALHPCV